MREANGTGFRPEIMERAWHLMAILDGISVHPSLKERLVLKGGTAFNLFFFDLPISSFCASLANSSKVFSYFSKYSQ